MKTIPDLAREILSRSPTPALPLPGLVEAIEEETTGHLPSPARILTEIRSRPDLFRVLDPVIGPWRRAKAEPGGPPPVEPRNLGSRPRSQHPNEFASFGSHLGKSSVPGKEGRREFGDGRGTLASTDPEVYLVWCRRVVPKKAAVSRWAG